VDQQKQQKYFLWLHVNCVMQTLSVKQTPQMPGMTTH